MKTIIYIVLSLVLIAFIYKFIFGGEIFTEYLDIKSQQTILKELNNRKLKYVNQVQITEKGYELGNAIASNIEKEWFENTDSSNLEVDFFNALQKCMIKNIKVIELLKKNENIEVQRKSFYENELDTFENVMVDAYKYNIENNLDLRPIFQLMGKENSIFIKPITISKASCLNCHGKKGENIKKEMYEKMVSNSSNYLLDKELGDLSGIWTIHIPIKNIIAELE